MLKTGYIHDTDGKKLCYVAEFTSNEELFYIVGYRKEWVVMKMFGNSAQYCTRIPEEAMQYLKELPNRPYDYKPYMQALSKS